MRLLRAFKTPFPAAAIAAVVSMAGCATGRPDATPAPAASAPIGSVADAPAARDPVGDLPADLSIEIHIRPGGALGGQSRVEERPASFVLLSDGTLHGETDLLPPEGVRPARVRRLSREQMAELWSTLRAVGFASPDSSDTTGNPRLATPGPREIIASIEVTADGRRFAFVRRYGPEDGTEPAMRRVIRAVGALAWASDEALIESAELPIRYEVGRDPYARFRKDDTR
ncbi:MAG: hypothetical protein RLZZ238_654 [Planctomycetota bacterium]